jgi:hypothetical protein
MRGVVAERRVIEGELHVLRHGQRSGLADSFSDEALE